jgi:hypothetical protein
MDNDGHHRNLRAALARCVVGVKVRYLVGKVQNGIDTQGDK